MNIRQAMQAGPLKVNALFAKLVDMSNRAAKTRDKTSGELKVELELIVDLEEQHLLPLLGQYKKTKDLISAAITANKTMRVRPRELDGPPRHEEVFGQRLMDLQEGFPRHVRDDKKELLPAVQQALSKGAASVAEGIEAGHSAARQAKRGEVKRIRVVAREAKGRDKRAAAGWEAKEARAAVGRAVQDGRDAPTRAWARSAACPALYRIVEGWTDGGSGEQQAQTKPCYLVAYRPPAPTEMGCSATLSSTTMSPPQ